MSGRAFHRATVELRCLSASARKPILSMPRAFDLTTKAGWKRPAKRHGRRSAKQAFREGQTSKTERFSGQSRGKYCQDCLQEGQGHTERSPETCVRRGCKVLGRSRTSDPTSGRFAGRDTERKPQSRAVPTRKTDSKTREKSLIQASKETTGRTGWSWPSQKLLSVGAGIRFFSHTETVSS